LSALNQADTSTMSPSASNDFALAANPAQPRSVGVDKWRGLASLYSQHLRTQPIIISICPYDLGLRRTRVSTQIILSLDPLPISLMMLELLTSLRIGFPTTHVSWFQIVTRHN